MTDWHRLARAMVLEAAVDPDSVRAEWRGPIRSALRLLVASREPADRLAAGRLVVAIDRAAIAAEERRVSALESATRDRGEGTNDGK